MKKKEGKLLKEKLIVAVNKTLKDNKAVLTDKIEKLVKKSVKQIVKKSRKKAVVKKKPVVTKSIKQP
jgi:hypothetical protein